MCDIVHKYIGSHSEVVLRQFPVLVGGRKFHIHVKCTVSLGSMHSGWMTIASSGRGKLFVAVLDRNRMLHVYSVTSFRCITECIVAPKFKGGAHMSVLHR